MSQTKLLIIGGAIGLGVVILVMFLILGSLEQPSIGAVTLQFWGTFDEPSFYTDVISDFKRSNPNVNVVYRKFNFEDYEGQLIDSFAAGTGPDVWLMHNTWLPKHGDKMQPLTPELFEEKQAPMIFKDFQEQFVDVAVRDLTFNSQIYSLPVYMDTLALYYNKDIFNTAGIAQPPATWNAFNDAISKLTIFDNRGNIVRSGAAIGTVGNINRSTDILMLLMLQSGVQMTDRDNTGAAFARSVENENVGEISLQFYTDFANPARQVYTWNDRQHYSIDAFTEGNTAMMFNYSHQIATLRDRASRLNFGVAPMPQILGSPVAVNYANYWSPAVSKQSKHPDLAWKFIVHLSSAKGATMYLNASSRPAARRDLIELQKSDPDLGIFATQSLSAKSWFQVDSSAIETIFGDMIDSINFGSVSIRDALQSAENKVSVLMARARR